MKRTYVSASDSLRPGQLDRLIAKIKDHKPIEKEGDNGAKDGNVNAVDGEG